MREETVFVEDSAPVYEEDSCVVLDLPIPASMVLVADIGVVEARLVEYEELGSASTGIWKTLMRLISQYA